VSPSSAEHHGSRPGPVWQERHSPTGPIVAAEHMVDEADPGSVGLNGVRSSPPLRLGVAAAEELA
jgi:hypothetical protein